MRTKVILPKSGMGIEDAIIGRWLKGVGDSVQKGDPLVEVETAKAVETVEAKVTGRLTAILAQPGESVAVNSPIAEIENDSDGL